MLFYTSQEAITCSNAPIKTVGYRTEHAQSRSSFFTKFVVLTDDFEHIYLQRRN